MVHHNDIEISASQLIDRLMRRVVLLMLGASVLSLAALWSMEVADHTIDSFNRYGYPTLIVAFGASWLALWRNPRMLRPVRWVGFICVNGLLMVDLWMQMSLPEPLQGNYNAMTLLNWLPLSYAMAFLILGTRQAVVAAATVLAFVGVCTVLRSTAATAYAGGDRALMVNTLISHTVLVACLTGMLWLKQAVTTQGEQARRLNLLAGTDPLTGVANRRHALHALEQLAREGRVEQAPALLLADLDHFKLINDGWGHAMGDQVLVAVATALRAGTRDADLVARWGGEEFLVVLPATRAGEPLEVAERLRQRVAALQVADRHEGPVPVTLSIGIATLGAGEDGAAWLRRADEALYRAKAEGRDRCVLA